MLVLVLKILVMDIERSRNAIRMQRLVQRIALLEAELRAVHGHQDFDAEAREQKEQDANAPGAS